MGAHFAVSAVGFSKVDEALGTVIILETWNNGVTVIPKGIFRIEDYHSEKVQQLMRSGKAEVVPDTTSFPKVIADNMAALNIGAYVNIPLVRDGRWCFTLSIIDSKPRDWRKDELELMSDLATRIWTRIERGRAEEALQKAALQKDEFIAVAAHELKTPVTSVKAYAQVLEHRFRKGGDTVSADMLVKMTSQVDKLTNLISDLLDVTKMESGKLEFQMEHFDIDLLIAETVEEIERTTDGRKFTLTLTKNTSVFADRDRIGQVLINLLSKCY